jgi:hypothetical protein
MNGFFRDIKGSVVVAAVMLIWDGAYFGSCLMSLLFCPFWFLLSLLKNAIERPGWGLALVRVAIPALTLGLVYVNNLVQLGVAEANARRVVAACMAYHTANGDFPKTLDELVPQYLPSVPRAKYCLGPPGHFYYHNFGSPKLYWQVVPPFDRKIYNFDTQRWSYLN